jgi:SAM-dependent methyltransferase
MTTENPPSADFEPWDAESYWEDRYRASERVWSGAPNVVLTRAVAALTPGTALDLGCAEGADAIWLAGNGWRVTAVDVSATALERGAGQAASAGVADQITWQKHDLSATFPTGRYDLVSVQFLHSPSLEWPREAILRQAAAAVAPGGVLLIVSHAAKPWGHAPGPEVRFPTAEETRDELRLDAVDWVVLELGTADRTATGHDGEAATLTDTIVELRRR